jgi:hypothetical protein
MRPSVADALALLPILLCFTLLGLLLPVGAKPPIGDAWSYAWSARQLAEHGVVRLTEFQAMSLVGQLWLTRPFTWAFSAEPAFLNLLTFAFSAVVACLFFLLLRATGAPRGLAGLGVAVLVFDPTYLAQSMTYDTEIYFLFAGLLGLLAFTHWLRTGRAGLLWLAGASFALAVLIRQHAITFALAALFALWWRGRRSEPGARAFGFAPFAALALAPLALLGFYAWLHLEHGVPKAYVWQQAELMSRLAHPTDHIVQTLGGGLASLHYLALFAAPLLPGLVLGDASRRHRRPAYAAATLVVGAGTGLLWLRGQHMPYLPLSFLHRPFDPLHGLLSGRALALALTSLSALLAIALLGEFVSRGLAASSRETAGGARQASIALLAASTALLVAFTIGTGLRFERHLLPPLPFLIALLLTAPTSRAAVAAGWVMLAPAALLSLHFVDQRVRAFDCEWRAAEAAVTLGYAPFSIDGGFAFNGYHSYQRLFRMYGRYTAMPWSPDAHPLAPIVIRRMPLPNETHELLEQYHCPNRAGLPDFEYWILRRRS